MADSIRVSVDVTKNLGDYNSLKLGVTLEREIKKSQTEEEAFDDAWAVVEAQIEKKLAEAEVD